MQIITSKENETVKYIKKLKDKKFRDETNEYIIEGIKLLQEAMQEKVTIKKIVLCEECDNGELKQNMLYEIAKYPCMYVSKKIFLSLSEVTTPQGVLAVVEKGDNSEKIDYTEDIIVALDGIADPGNLGTILRSASAFGIDGVILFGDTVDLYNPKCVRASVGNLWKNNILLVKNIDELKDLLKDFTKIGTLPKSDNSVYLSSFDFPEKSCVFFGSEADGLSDDLKRITDTNVTIEMKNSVESLNLGISAGIIMYEMRVL